MTDAWFTLPRLVVVAPARAWLRPFITWREKGEKTRREVEFPISQRIAKELHDFCEVMPIPTGGWLIPQVDFKLGTLLDKPMTTDQLRYLLEQAEIAAGLTPLKHGKWHPYRRKFATEQKDLPVKDVMAAMGLTTLKVFFDCYQQSDESKKKGEKLALTSAQRAAVDRALEGFLSEPEADFNARDAATNYYLLPGGPMAGGRAAAPRARALHVTRSAALKFFHELEVAAGVEPQLRRGRYGLRRVATDLAPSYTSDRRVLDKLGGWVPGSTTREDTYQDRDHGVLLAETAVTRQAWRIGEKSVAAGLPVSTETMLTLLPEELRAQVLTHFGGTPVGTAVGTNDNAVEAKGSDGVVSR